MAGGLPFVLPWRPAVQPVLFVHAVQGLPPGIYAVDRCDAALPGDWAEPAGDWKGCRLRRLHAAENAGRLGYVASAHQCKNAAFHVALFASVAAVQTAGPSMYPRLHWEVGALGQLLYLACEEQGLRGTSIGCYFGPWTAALLGFETAWMDLLHWAGGIATPDARVQARELAVEIRSRSCKKMQAESSKEII